MVRYGGFIIDWLYGLESATIEPSTIHRAAVICRILIRFWQQRQETIRDGDATFALPMLWRSYWKALDMLMFDSDNQQHTETVYEWRNINLYNEYDHAFATWQGICIQERYAWFFADYMWAWHHQSAKNWQHAREDEVHVLVWKEASKRQILRAPAGTTPPSLRHLHSIIDQWYMPRYDLKFAERVRNRIAGDWRSKIPTWITQPLRLPRLYAAIGVGYIATALQSDTWIILYELTSMNLFSNIPGGILIMSILGLGTLVYLFDGIRRKTGIGLHALGRAWRIWLYGEGVAILFGVALTFFIAPIVQFQDQPLSALLASPLFLIPIQSWQITIPMLWIFILVYAQFTLFFGVFVQLLFDEKTTTTPLDAP